MMNTVGMNSIALWKVALGIRKEAVEKAAQEYDSYVAEIRSNILKDRFLDAYIACALNTSDGDGVPLKSNYGPKDIALDTLFAMVQDCFNFRVANAADMKGLNLEQCGQDFWVTRQRERAGFQEHNLGKAGERLTQAAEKFGKVRLHIAEDGQIYQ